MASCWGDGRVVRMTLDAAGRPSAPVIGAAAADPYGPDADPADSRAVDLSGSVDPRRGADRSGVDLSRGADLAAAARALRAAAGDEYAHLVPAYDAEPVAPERSRSRTIRHPRVSRAHQAVFLPGGLIATTDMGLDLVRFWRTAGSGLRPVQQVVLPLGSGPRHMVLHPSGHLYVVTELVVRGLRARAGRRRALAARRRDSARRRHARRTTPRPSSPHRATASSSTPACAAATRSRRCACAAPARRSRRSRLVESGVDWPRHHVVVRDTLLVAGPALRRGRLAHARHPHRCARPRAPPRRGAVADVPAGG